MEYSLTEGNNNKIGDPSIYLRGKIMKDSSIFECKISGDYKVENQKFSGRNLTNKVSKDCATAIEISDKSKVFLELL